MSSYRVSSATPTTSLVTTQAVMKEKIFEELESATFTVALTAWGGSLQADPHDVQMVADYLQHNINLTHNTLFSDSVSTEAVPRLPPRGFSAERDSYGPFAHLLNILVLAVKTCVARARYLKDLHFGPYDVPMANILDSRTALKPNILGLLRPRTSDRPKNFWEDVAVIIEVKDHSLNTVKQLATYARDHLSLDRRRSFSIAIAIDHKALTLRFLCFHRSGVSSSELLKLKEKDGFRSVVEHMVGILSIRDEAAFGLDTTRVKDVYRLNGRYYDIVRTIQNRDCIRGHATAVYSLKLRTTVSIAREDGV
ncbi:hypothetical protein H4582DRAFT_615904 [Lactarius indigo]|nr:hypothetical protein H4582DRAFT_615904 [Lactarius indigo]